MERGRRAKRILIPLARRLLAVHGDALPELPLAKEGRRSLFTGVDELTEVPGC
jgi:hypothetical protein